MAEYLIVDGYNVINSWKDFEKLRSVSMDHAREVLISQVSEYAAFKGLTAILVFDAQENQNPGSKNMIQGIEVVFTEEGETADTWIERKTYELGRHTKMYVVTSDYAEQLHVLGAGAYRVSSREFREEYMKTKKEIAAQLKIHRNTVSRMELDSRIKRDVLAKLELMRRGK